jgi:predicted flap endonuclease-1-like 5' DNA nuclease
MSKLSVIEGIGDVYMAKLNKAGIKSTDDLLSYCATKKNRTELSEMTAISEKLILKWANHADLARIKGISGEYAELLEASGVDTVPELAQRNAENLFQKLQEVNEEKALVRKLPSQSQVKSWIEQAFKLQRILTY